MEHNFFFKKKLIKFTISNGTQDFFDNFFHPNVEHLQNIYAIFFWKNMFQLLYRSNFFIKINNWERF